MGTVRKVDCKPNRLKLMRLNFSLRMGPLLRLDKAAR